MSCHSLDCAAILKATISLLRRGGCVQTLLADVDGRKGPLGRLGIGYTADGCATPPESTGHKDKLAETTATLMPSNVQAVKTAGHRAVDAPNDARTHARHRDEVPCRARKYRFAATAPSEAITTTAEG
jgi:hypothetical protein